MQSYEKNTSVQNFYVKDWIVEAKVVSLHSIMIIGDMRKNILLTLMVLMGCSTVNAVTYTREDSLKVVKLLGDARKDKPENLMVYYGMKLCGLPYVAHTLEVNDAEQLVVNLRQMDCTTLVETVLALSLTARDGSVKWEDYCRWLQTIRYRDGIMKGYTSRNHYFLWWVESNSRLGLVNVAKYNNLARQQTISINYMSEHPSAYKMLKGKNDDIKKIKALENVSKGKVMKYIPASKVGLGKDKLGFVKDGDILAIATKKAGLDTSHIGIAKWGKDGKLHLLNASQVHKKVVLEPMTLYDYMKKHPSQLGVWVIHVANSSSAQK